MKTLLIDLDLQRFLTLSAFLLCVMLIDCCLLLFRVQETTLWWSHPLLVFLSGLYSKPSQQYLRAPNFSLIVLIDTTHTLSSLTGTAWFSARLNTIFIIFISKGTSRIRVLQSPWWVNVFFLFAKLSTIVCIFHTGPIWMIVLNSDSTF